MWPGALRPNMRPAGEPPRPAVEAARRRQVNPGCAGAIFLAGRVASVPLAFAHGSAPEEFLRYCATAPAGCFRHKLHTLLAVRGPRGSMARSHLYCAPVMLHAGPMVFRLAPLRRADITRPSAGRGSGQIIRLIGAILAPPTFHHHPERPARISTRWPGVAEGHSPRDRRPPHRTNRPSKDFHRRPRPAQGLGVTTSNGMVREGMAAKFRQINRFVELLAAAPARGATGRLTGPSRWPTWDAARVTSPRRLAAPPRESQKRPAHVPQ